MAKSLAESKGLVPATFTEAFDSGSGAVVEVQQRFTTPYVVFAQPAAAEQFKTLMQSFNDIQDGDPVLIYPPPEKPIRLQPFKCTLIAAKQFFSEFVPGSKGTVKANHINNGPGFGERIWCALIVYLADRAVPVTCLAKTVKCPAFASLAAELEACKRPDWIKNGTAHEQAVAACAVPMARIAATITMAGRTSNKSMAYVTTRAHIAPSTSTEWKLLQTVDDDQMRKCAEAYNRYITELQLVP